MTIKWKKITAYVLGNRDELTTLELYEKIKDYSGSFYKIDEWVTFEKVLKDKNEKFIVGKEYTYPIEQNNSNTRHYLARFHRRTKVVSRSKQMVDISIKLTVLRYDYPHYLAQYLQPVYPR